MRAAARAALGPAHPRGGCEWTVRLADDAELARLNGQFRGIDRPTDVLSFGAGSYRDGRPHTGARQRAPGAEVEVEVEYLGDIVISLERCAAQAAAGGHGMDDELALLVVHGTLHLLGYDHDTPARKARMWAAQSRALDLLGIHLTVR